MQVGAYRGAYRLWKATECASLEMGSLGQVLRCVPLLDAALLSPGHSSRPLSTAAGEEEERVITNPRVLELAEQITQLNLLEVSDLTELLRKRLNIQTPAGGMGFAFPAGGMPMAAAPAAGRERTAILCDRLGSPQGRCPSRSSLTAAAPTILPCRSCPRCRRGCGPR